MITIEQIRIGSQVLVRGGFGSEPAKIVTVEGVDADIKNGRAGIDYTESPGNTRWAYLSQVEKVVAY